MKSTEERLDKLEQDYKVDVPFLLHHQFEHCQDLVELYDKIEALEQAVAKLSEATKEVSTISGTFFIGPPTTDCEKLVDDSWKLSEATKDEKED